MGYDGMFDQLADAEHDSENANIAQARLNAAYWERRVNELVEKERLRLVLRASEQSEYARRYFALTVLPEPPSRQAAREAASHACRSCLQIGKDAYVSLAS